MKFFRGALAMAWLLTWALMARATLEQGTAESLVFFADFAQPWRGMLNTDFLLHMWLVAAWIAYRERSLLVGIPCALFASMGGMPFTAMYLLVTTYRENGDMRRLLLGRHCSS